MSVLGGKRTFMIKILVRAREYRRTTNFPEIPLSRPKKICKQLISTKLDTGYRLVYELSYLVAKKFSTFFLVRVPPVGQKCSWTIEVVPGRLKNLVTRRSRSRFQIIRNTVRQKTFGNHLKGLKIRQA